MKKEGELEGKKRKEGKEEREEGGREMGEGGKKRGRKGEREALNEKKRWQKMRGEGRLERAGR